MAFYDIPLDALHSIDRDNLWAAGRLVSSDADAYCSLRVMGTAFATGHAAGVAAALQATGDAPTAVAVQASCVAKTRSSRRWRDPGWFWRHPRVGGAPRLGEAVTH